MTVGRISKRKLRKWEGKYPEDLMQSVLKVIFGVEL
jgi:hypothetical protein